MATDTYLTQLTEQFAGQIKSGPSKKRAAAESEERLTEKDVQKRFQKAYRQAEVLGDEKVIPAVLAAAARSSKIIVPLAQWDANPDLCGTLNGTLNVITRTHHSGLPKDYITRALDVCYDRSATAPEWKKFLDKILPEDLQNYLQRLAGYSLTGNTDDQAFYFLYGTGKNGKSIFVAVLCGIFRDYGGKARRNLIEEARNGADCKHDLALIPGVRFLHGEETSADGRLREDVLKSLTGGSDLLTGEAKYCTPFSFRPCAKLWLMGNHKPWIDGTDNGIWRRVRLIPFETSITDEEEIPSSILLARFKKERAGILNWMLAGLAANGPGPVSMPQSVKEAVAEYRESEDVLGEFVAECTRDAAKGYKEPKHTIYAAYEQWAEKNGIKFPWSMKKFSRRLKDRQGWSLCPSRTHWLAKSLSPEL